uniref:Uncharacterized protein n=1 Tax=Apteryx owenii TaxID=8824 RepID=A0A8B9PJ05_APTOW
MSGSLAGMVATIVTYPTDVIKTRLIVQNRLEPSYKGILHAFCKINHQEGFLALYHGVSPAILGKIVMRKITFLGIIAHCLFAACSCKPSLSGLLSRCYPIFCWLILCLHQSGQNLARTHNSFHSSSKLYKWLCSSWCGTDTFFPL